MVIENKKLMTINILKDLVQNRNGFHYAQMKQAIWLYVFVILNVDLNKGSINLKYTDISRLTGIREPIIRTWLGQLSKYQYLNIKKMGSNVKISLPNALRKRYPNENDEIENNESIKDQTLANQIAHTLKEPDKIDMFQDLVKKHNASLIRRALREASAIPNSRIKKSRAALFYFLINKYASKK
jgi:hypothetical protein